MNKIDKRIAETVLALSEEGLQQYVAALQPESVLYIQGCLQEYEAEYLS